MNIRTKKIIKSLKKKTELSVLSVLLICCVCLMFMGVLMYYVGYDSGSRTEKLNNHNKELREQRDHLASTRTAKENMSSFFSYFFVYLAQHIQMVCILLAIVLLIHGFKVIG